MHWHARHLRSDTGDSTCVIERAEAHQQVARLSKSRCRGRIEPAQALGAVGAPACQLERQGSEVGFQNLSGSVRGQLPLRRLAPESVANAGSKSPGAPGALLACGTRDAHQLQSAHAGCRVETCAAFEPRVDDRRDGGHGDAGFGDVGRKDHLTQRRACRDERRILRLTRQLPVQRNHAHLRW